MFSKPEYNSRGADDFIVFYFDAVSTVHGNTISMRFHLYPFSRAFSDQFGFDEYTQQFSVDRRPKRIKMYAFSNVSALLWRGPKATLGFIGKTNMKEHS